jgi:hypothetical protein
MAPIFMIASRSKWHVWLSLPVLPVFAMGFTMND